MKLQYLVQPEVQVGRLVSDFMDSEPRPNRIVLISAFASRQTLLRYRTSIIHLHKQGAHVRFVLGIDLGGTSKEALEELLSWGIDVRLIKHRRSGYTFHPKIFLFERDNRADILVGSNNLTEGGFFKNYEGCVYISYDLPADLEPYTEAQRSLNRFLDPSGVTSKVLTPELLECLVRRGDIPTEKTARIIRGEALKRREAAGAEPSPFGVEEFASPPPIPAEVLEDLFPIVRAERRKRKSKPQKRKPVAVKSAAEIAPTYFYMTLPKMLGKIPGEPRVPLEARDIAEEFWGWPERYILPERKVKREYWEWKPFWRIWDAETPDEVEVVPVRMYMYSESSDFRFYSKRLLNLGADEGDIVQITRISESGAEFECVLARKGTKIHRDWMKYCTELVRNSDRRYGYA